MHLNISISLTGAVLRDIKNVFALKNASVSLILLNCSDNFTLKYLKCTRLLLIIVITDYRS